VQQWGEPRLTRDIDVAVLAGFGNEARIRGCAPVEISAHIADARQFSCKPPGLKVFAGRPTELRDARSVIVRQSDKNLDWTYVERHLSDRADLSGGSRSLSDLANLRHGDERP
jgi:hypothetical protein